MRFHSLIGGRLSRLLWRVLSIPLFFKIMGIGVVVAIVFASTTLLQIHGAVSQALYGLQEDRTWSISRSLAADIERPMSTGDLLSVQEKIHQARRLFPDIRYVIVRGAGGQVVSHTFQRSVPDDLLATAAESPEFRVLSSQEGLLFDVSAPILDGHAGALRLGMSDRFIRRDLNVITRLGLWSLALCFAIGTGLAVLLTHILTRPINHLVSSANRIRGGDFDTRSEVYFADEIGKLALAFNQMAESLHSYRREVQEREQARQTLLQKIVHTQEEERRSISRELHDELGQSLSALLLAVQTLCKTQGLPDDLCNGVQERIRSIIEEVRRLAWGMRPSILDDYGLDSALARHVEETSHHFGLKIDYQYTCLPELERPPRQIEVSLYRVAQEALRNVVRHARATQCSVVVLRRRDEVTLLIEDNGQGFNVAAVEQNGDGCLGLTGMKERVALLNGSCAIESTVGQGSIVRVRIPLNEDASCQFAS